MASQIGSSSPCFPAEEQRASQGRRPGGRPSSPQSPAGAPPRWLDQDRRPRPWAPPPAAHPPARRAPARRSPEAGVTCGSATYLPLPHASTPVSSVFLCVFTLFLFFSLGTHWLRVCVFVCVCFC